jgi:hypothetical protein
VKVTAHLRPVLWSIMSSYTITPPYAVMRLPTFRYYSLSCCAVRTVSNPAVTHDAERRRQLVLLRRNAGGVKNADVTSAAVRKHTLRCVTNGEQLVRSSGL